MIRRLPGLALAGLLLLPGNALAADPTPPVAPVVGHYYYLAALEVGGTATKTEGKLWIEGRKLGVSVGCNSIGAEVTFDGRILTITGGIVTTEMGCPPEIAPREAALLAALAAGPFTWDGSGFVGKGARLVASEVGTGPVTPPDAVVVKPGLPFDIMTCKDFVTAEAWAAFMGGGVASTTSDAASGSGSGGAGVSGVGGSPVQVAPVPPSPAATAGVRPGATPAARAAQPSGAPVAPPAVDLPLASAPATKGGVVTQAPTATPSADLCRELLTRVSAMSAGGVAMPKGGPQDAPGGAALDAAFSREAAGGAGGAAAALLVAALGLLLVWWLRSLAAPGVRQTRR